MRAQLLSNGEDTVRRVALNRVAGPHEFVLSFANERVSSIDAQIGVGQNPLILSFSKGCVFWVVSVAPVASPAPRPVRRGYAWICSHKRNKELKSEQCV